MDRGLHPELSQLGRRPTHRLRERARPQAMAGDAIIVGQASRADIHAQLPVVAAHHVRVATLQDAPSVRVRLLRAPEHLLEMSRGCGCGGSGLVRRLENGYGELRLASPSPIR